jgi:hypothetical protein
MVSWIEGEGEGKGEIVREGGDEGAVREVKRRGEGGEEGGGPVREERRGEEAGRGWI